MPTLYVENVPEDLYGALRKRARSNRTSISVEVLSASQGKSASRRRNGPPQGSPCPRASDSFAPATILRPISHHRGNAAGGSVSGDRLRSRCQRGSQVVPAAGTGAHGGRGIANPAGLGSWQSAATDLPISSGPSSATFSGRRRGSGRISRKTAEESIEAIGAVELTTAPCRPLLKNAFAIAATFGRSVYRRRVCSACGRVRHAPCYADERLANALAAVFPVRWLGSL